MVADNMTRSPNQSGADGAQDLPEASSVTLRPRQKPTFDWSASARRPRHPLARKRFSPAPWAAQVLRFACLVCLCAVYLGPLNQPATAVVSVNKVLPVYSVERDDPVVSVTFDASWGGDQTIAILDILDEYNAKATFYLVGIWVDAFPELVKEIADRGHEIGNHSDTHAHMPELSANAMRQELSALSDKVEKITGKRPTLFRAPYGDYNNQVVTVAREEGYEVVQWSVDSLDWKNRGVQDLIQRATKNVNPGDIILFHNDSQYILDALPTILKTYQEQGFEMIKASDILLQGNTTIDVQGKQHPAD